MDYHRCCWIVGFLVVGLSSVTLSLTIKVQRSTTQRHALKAINAPTTDGSCIPLRSKLRQQPSFGLIDAIKGNEIADITVIDLISVLGRIESREDFYPGTGYARPAAGLLTKSRFYETMQLKEFKRWPSNTSNKPLGCVDISQQDFDELCIQLRSSPVSKVGCDALFASFSKGAVNGVAYPQQVDEEMKKWLSSTGQFDLAAFEQSLLLGKVNVAVGWFLFLGLQFVAYYVIFFVPIMQQLYPDFDYYFVRTYLHVHLGLG